MRRVINLIIVLGLACIPLGMYYRDHRERVLAEQIAATRQAVIDIYNQAIYHGSLGGVAVTDRQWPLEIRRDWFDPVPVNPLIDQPVPWLAVADESERSLIHPRRLVADGQTSAFWYNPYRQVVRARVPRQHTDQATRQLYYRVNQISGSKPSR